MEQLTAEAIATALVAALAFVARALLRFARSPEGRVVLRVLRDASASAAIKAHAAFRASIAHAQARDSDGGPRITQAERRAIARDAVDAFTHELDVLGVLEKVGRAFGGVEKLEDEMVKRMEEKLKKFEGG